MANYISDTSLGPAEPVCGVWPGRTPATPWVAASGVGPGILSSRYHLSHSVNVKPYFVSRAKAISWIYLMAHRGVSLRVITSWNSGLFTKPLLQLLRLLCGFRGLFHTSCGVVGALNSIFSPGVMWQQNVQLDGGRDGRESDTSCWPAITDHLHPFVSCENPAAACL